MFTGKPSQRHQCGAALIVMLVIMVMGITVAIVGALNSSRLQAARQQATAFALGQARDALIGRAVADDSMPGSLPCPDTDNDGSAELLSGNNCPSYIGRLPWRTLKLPDLRDGNGERLWYALSPNFRDDDSSHPINSDTAGQLSITGNASIGNVVAIVFAPGAPLCGQSRPGNSASGYLEAGDGSSNAYALKSPDNDCSDSTYYNDDLIAITAEQLMRPIEKRVGNQIASILNTYHGAWGAYPFAVPFTNPSTSSFTGAPGTTYGLLPVGDTVIPTWSAVPNVTFSGSGSYSSCELRDGNASNSRWRCYDITISPGETITITGTLNSVGLGLWRPHNTSNICEVRARDSSGTTVLATTVLDNVSVTGALNADGSATIVFRGTGKSGYGSLQRIELRDILTYATDIQAYDSTSPSCPQTSTNPTIPTWLFDDSTYGNNWHQVAYYAVSPGHVPGGGSCTALPGTPSCLTLGGSGGGTDKRALVIMTGAALPGKTHPSASLVDYLEGENATPADFTHERQSPDSNFNDQVIIVAP